MNKFRHEQGNKSKIDRVLYFNGVRVKYEDIAKMCIFFMINEDNLYPPDELKKNGEPKEGAKRFIRYIKEVLDTRKIPNRKKYGLDKDKLVKVWGRIN